MKRRLFFLLSLGLLACGGDDGGGDQPVGTDHTYVISSFDVPTTRDEASMLGVDLDTDGTADNELGYSLYALAEFLRGVTVQATNDELIDRGTSIMLVNVKATGLTAASNAGVWFYLGTDNVTPSACDDTECRKHFTGSAMFETDRSGPANAPVTGDIVNGTFTGDSGKATLKLSIIGAPIQIPLQRVGVTLSGVSPTGWAASGSKIHGVVTETDFNGTVVPQFANALQVTYDELCFLSSAPPAPPLCSCASDLGEDLLRLVDSNQDCEMSDAEAAGFLEIHFRPDLDLDENGTPDAISAAFGIGGTSGIFTVPSP